MSVAFTRGVVVPCSAVVAALVALTPVPLAVPSGISFVAIGVVGAALLALMNSTRGPVFASVSGDGALAGANGTQPFGRRSGVRS